MLDHARRATVGTRRDVVFAADAKQLREPNPEWGYDGVPTFAGDSVV